MTIELSRSEAARIRFLRENKELIAPEVLQVLKETSSEEAEKESPEVNPLVMDILKELRRHPPRLRGHLRHRCVWFAILRRTRPVRFCARGIAPRLRRHLGNWHLWATILRGAHAMPRAVPNAA